MRKFIISRFPVLSAAVICAILRKQVKAEQLINRRFLEEMEKDGTFDRLRLAR